MTEIPAQEQQWPGTTAALDPQPDHGETSWVGRDRLVGKRVLVTGCGPIGAHIGRRDM